MPRIVNAIMLGSKACRSLTLCLSLLWQYSITAQQTNVVVVGAGISGLCAALESARLGASVTVVDMASVFGGHAVMSSGLVCVVGTPEQDRIDARAERD